MKMGCFGNCGEVGPPPDMILSMPPPPLPSFLLPRNSIIAFSGNETHPCFAAFMCEPSPHPRESGVEFIEFPGKGQIDVENTWLFVLLTSCIGVIFLGALLAFVLIKCRDFTYSYEDGNMKQTTMSALGEPTKSNPFMSGGMLYPCTSDKDSLQQHLENENRLLWATLTPHGTRHFVSDFPSQDGHYEAVDYKSKNQNLMCMKATPIKSFDNSGFIDYDYEDPTPLMDSYHDDLDSGYQEPQDVNESITRISSSSKPMVSSPTRIENPNIPPLNICPQRTSTTTGTGTGTLNRKAQNSLRRIGDASSFGSQNI